MTTTSTLIHLGAEVCGTNGKLGELSRLIVDSRSKKASEIVVKHGFLFGRERTVHLGHITTVEDNVIHLDMDEHGLEQMNGFTEERMPGQDPDYSGPPPADNDGTYRAPFVLDTAVAQGSAAGLGTSGKPLGYPGGEALAPEFTQRPAITKGTDVLDTNGEKIGDLDDLTVDARTGSPVRLVVRKGLIFSEDMEFSGDKIRDLSSEGIILNVSKERALGSKP
jgi:uncharacterized protein YrrD